MSKIADHASLIAALGGAAEVAGSDAVDTLAVTVRAWAARNRIPPEHWPGVISLAATKRVTINAEWLMSTTPPRRRAAEEQVAA